LRAEIEKQIRLELSAQIDLIRKRCSRGRIAVDGHRHAHLLPFVWPLLIADAGWLGITGMRTVNEPARRPDTPGAAIINLLSLHPGKRLLLNRLSRPLVAVLDDRGLTHPDYSVGLVHSGRMNAKTVLGILGRISARGADDQSRVELVFRTAPARSPDHHGDRPGRVWRFAASARQSTALTMLEEPGFRRMIASFRRPDSV
jgi:hypothetical protein